MVRLGPVICVSEARVSIEAMEFRWGTAEGAGLRCGCCLPRLPYDDASLPYPPRRRLRYGPRITAEERTPQAVLLPLGSGGDIGRLFDSDCVTSRHCTFFWNVII